MAVYHKWLKAGNFNGIFENKPYPQLTISYLYQNTSMISTNDVYRKIKEMSKRVANPRPQITISAVAGELSLQSEQILPSLTELKDMRLIQLDKPINAAYVKLTLLGHTVNR